MAASASGRAGRGAGGGAVQGARPRPGGGNMAAPSGGRADNGYGGQAARRRKGPSALATAYLVIYNVVMTAG